MRNLAILFFVYLIDLVGFSQTQYLFDAANDGQTINTCNGFLIASGGQGTSQYSVNEDYTITFCADNPDDVITITFGTFNLDPTDLLPGNPSNADVMHVYDGTSTAANYLGGYNTDGLQGAVIKATPQNPSGCITLRFVSNAQGIGMFSASVTCTTPCADPFADGFVVNGITQDSIHACIGELIQFQELGSFAQLGFNLVNYSWDFMDGTTATGQTVSHAYQEAGYYRVQLFVTDDNGCTNNNLIDLDIKIATPPNFESFVQDTTICIGESLELRADPLLYENTWYSIIGSVEIDDGCMYDTLLGVAQELEIVQTDFISGITITDITQIESFCLDIEHTFIGDLVISIICPNGQTALLHQQGGGGTMLGTPVETDGIDCDDPTTYGTPFTYCFTPTATDTWVEYTNANAVAVLPAGDYEPIEPLSQLIGCPANGVWTLSVVDNWGADDGKVFSFGLNLSPDLYGDVVEFTPEHSTPSDSSYWHYPSTFGTFLSPDADTMRITPTAAGVYHYPYTVVNDFGCSNDTSVTVTVFEVEFPMVLNDLSVCPETPFTVEADFLTCDFILRLVDNFGDSWNGNSLNVTLNGITTNYTVDFDDDFGSMLEVLLTLAAGDVLTFVFDDSGSFIDECSYQLVDCAGNIVLDQQPTLNTTPVNYTTVIPTVTQGPVGYSFQWSPANIFVDPNVAIPTGLVDNTTTLTVNFFPDDHPLCIASSSMVVNLIPNSDPGMDSTIAICTNFTTWDLFPLLGPTASTFGVWTDPNGATVTMPIDLTTSPQGNYVYTVGVQSCLSSATINNQIKSEPEMHTDFITDPDICIGETALFLNSNNFPNLQSMIIDFGDTSDVQNITANYDSVLYVYPYVGTFDLTVAMISTNGCFYNDTFPQIVSVHNYPTADFTIFPEEIDMLEPYVNVTNNSTLFTTFNWEFQGATADTSTSNSVNLVYDFEAGLFPVTLYIEDSVGCRDSITKMVKINDIPLVYFANSFTPNGDEYNQDWRIFASGVDLQNFILKIYNRWGELIFETKNPNVGWNGTYNNQMCPSGIYIWKLEAVETITNTRFEKEGHINLIR